MYVTRFVVCQMSCHIDLLQVSPVKSDNLEMMVHLDQLDRQVHQAAEAQPAPRDLKENEDYQAQSVAEGRLDLLATPALWVHLEKWEHLVQVVQQVC